MSDSQEIVRELRAGHGACTLDGECAHCAMQRRAATALEASERRCAELEAEIVAFRALVKDNSNMHDDALAREYQRGYQAGERDAYQ